MKEWLCLAAQCAGEPRRGFRAKLDKTQQDCSLFKPFGANVDRY